MRDRSPRSGMPPYRSGAGTPPEAPPPDDGSPDRREAREPVSGRTGARRNARGSAAVPHLSFRDAACTQRDNPDGAGEGDPYEEARAICLRLLSGAPRTRAQLAEGLRRRGVEDGIAESVLVRFAEVGLVDDAAFARAWVDSRHHGRGLARRALAHELRHRGVAEDLVSDAVDELDRDTEFATAVDLARRRLASLARHERAVRIRRTAALLARKGYPPGLAARALRTALDAVDDHGDIPDMEADTFE